MKDIYLYSTETVYKNGEQVGYTELYAPKVYGGRFVGMIVNGMLISGEKKNGEFSSDAYHGCCVYAPTAERLLMTQLAANRTEKELPKIVCETKGYASVKDACMEYNQIGETETREWACARLVAAADRKASRINHQHTRV